MRGNGDKSRTHGVQEVDGELDELVILVDDLANLLNIKVLERVLLHVEGDEGTWTGNKA